MASMHAALSEFESLNSAFDEIPMYLNEIGTEANQEPLSKTITWNLNCIYGIPAFCYNHIPFYNTIPSLKLKYGKENQQVLEIVNSFVDDSNIPQSPIWKTNKFYFNTRTKSEHVIPLEWRVILLSIKEKMKTGVINVIRQNATIYQKGAFLMPTRYTNNSIATLIIVIGDYTGGDIVVHQDQAHNIGGARFKSKEAYWLAFTSECMLEIRPVESGPMVVLTYQIISSSEFLEGWGEYVTPAYGPPSKLLQQQGLNNIGDSINRYNKDVGLMLAEKYTKKPLELTSLEGRDTELVNRLTETGFRVEMLSVIFRDHDEATDSKKCVFLFSPADYEYCNGTRGPPNNEDAPEDIAFFSVGTGKLLRRSIKRTKAKNVYTESLYWCIALLIHKPTAWTFCRQLWIGKLKNSPQECILATLPKEIVREITWHYQQAFQQMYGSKKRKRESDSDSYESS